MASEGPQKVTLYSNDGVSIVVDRAVAERSMLIKNMVEDLGDEAVSTQAIPIPNVNEAVLRKVIEWCEHHRNDPPQTNDDESDSRKKTTEIEEWDQKFMQVDQEMLFEIILVGAPASSWPSAARGFDIWATHISNTLRWPPTTSTSNPFWTLAARPLQT